MMLLMDEVDLGKRLQTARKASGLTQQQLCQKAGLSYSTLAKIERGAIKSPSIFTIQSISDALGLTLNQLMGESSISAKKRSKSGVRFVYFDINGCLVRSFQRSFGRIAEDSGTPIDVVETTFWRYNDQVCRGEMSLDDFNKTLAEEFGTTVDFAAYYLEAVEPIPETQELLRWAAESYKVGLLTNIMPGLIDAMFERNILPDVAFDAIIDSSKIGAIKPEAKIYEIAQDWASVAPEEILFVDDSHTNLVPAIKRGWHAMWFDDFQPKESAARIRSALEF